MPSPITTGGFQVSQMPSVNFTDPRLLTPQYGNIIPSIGQGMGVYNQFQQIQDEAAMRPIRQQMAQIQLQQAQDQLAQAPMRQQLAQAQLQEAQQNAAVPRIIPGDTTIQETQTSPYDMPALDENGKPTAPVPMGDLVQITNEQLYGPGGVITPRVVTKTLKTAAERVAEEEKRQAAIRATDALTASRTHGKDFEYSDAVQKYQDAVDTGDMEAAQFYKDRLDRLNMQPGLIAPGVNYQRRIEQLAADAGITLEHATELSKTPEGAATLAAAAVANKAAARSFFGAPKLTPAQQAMIQGSAATGANIAAPAATDFASRADMLLGQKSAAAFPTLSVTEAIAAPAGTIFIGIDGKKRKKNTDGTVSLILE